MSKTLAFCRWTPQAGLCARVASQAILKELLGKALARRGVAGCVASPGQALWGLACLRALPETPRHCQHFEEISFGICSTGAQSPGSGSERYLPPSFWSSGCRPG